MPIGQRWAGRLFGANIGDLYASFEGADSELSGMATTVVASVAKLIRKNWLVAAAIVITCPSTGFAEDQKYTGCISNSYCDTESVRLRCNAEKEDLGKAVCQIRTERGTQIYPYTVKKFSDKHEGKCGVAKFHITCHDMPDDSVTEWHTDVCRANARHLCEGYTYHRCGTPPEEIGKAKCGDAPFQIFPWSSRERQKGEKCGIVRFRIGCHRG